jgi:hypothetical protein
MEIEFINHACFILEHQGVQIIHDPWLWGTAFNDGWDLICASPFKAEDFARIDYIWFSHEHPDHFSTSVVKAIPAEMRKQITVLFQETKDKKVLRFCREQGFETVELPHHKPTRLKNGLEIVCGTVPFFDSWIHYRGGGHTILNVNDCVVDGQAVAEDIKEVTGEVDILLTQFSYAAWKGNVNDKLLREESAHKKLDTVKYQIRVFRPKFTIPFASFVYFSHVDNRFMNDSINTPATAARAIESAGSIPVVLFPGDRWDLSSSCDNTLPLQRWEREYAALPQRDYHTSKPVSEEELRESCEKYLNRIRTKNSNWMMWLISKLPLGFLAPLNIHVTDHAAVYRFSFRGGLQKLPPHNTPDVSMDSDSLNYVFLFDWGYDTLTVNGRFQANPAGFRKMTKSFAIGPLNNTGRYVSLKLLCDFSFIKAFLSALGKFTKRLRHAKVGQEAA